MTIEQQKQKVLNFANLKPGWDSYNAPKISELSIKAALSFLNSSTIPFDWIEPTCDGMIIAELTLDGVLWEFDFCENGQTLGAVICGDQMGDMTQIEL